jgi:hypothetical protein
VFIQVIQGKCTRRDELRAMSDRWERELGPAAAGWLGATYGVTDDDVAVAVVRFESREAAEANSARPEQSQWWSETEKLFSGPVEFHDCDDVTVMLDGGSDSAGFVQIIQGKAADRDRLKAMVTDTDRLHEARPEIIGGTLAIADDDTFTNTVAFTDEASARKGEQVEMPDDVREDMEAAIREPSYLDLHQPWFASKG